MTNPLTLKFWLVANIALAEKKLETNPNETITVRLDEQKEIMKLALERLEIKNE